MLRSKGQHPFDLTHEVGQRPEALKPAKNKALGAKVVYNKPMNKSYTAGGEQALVDGKRGGWAYSDAGKPSQGRPKLWTLPSTWARSPRCQASR